MVEPLLRLARRSPAFHSAASLASSSMLPIIADLWGE
jgi:hypothetical protein